MCNACDVAQNATNYRHRWEIPLVVVAWVLSILAVVGSITAAETMTSLAENEDAALFLNLGYAVVTMPFLIFVLRFYQAAKERSNGIKVGPQQFPEIWEIYTELLAKFELAHAPGLYVINGNGQVNAYALSCSVQHKYVVLHAEIAALVHLDPQIVRFVLAHELAHHKLGHVSLIRLAVETVMRALFLPGQALTRAQEYSADRLAMAVCPEASDTIAFLTVGPWMAERLNTEAFAEQIEGEESSLMVRVVNIASDHAVMTKRFKALRDIAKHGFEKHGQMF